MHQVTSELGAGVWGGEFGDRRKGHASDRFSSIKLGTESRKMMKQALETWVGIGGQRILLT